MRVSLVERAGTGLLVVLVAVTVGIVVVSAALRSAADDLYASIDQTRGIPMEHGRTAYGMWLSQRLSNDVAASDLEALRARADVLAYRSDRLREAAAVPAIIGLLAGLLSGTPEPEPTGTGRRRPAIQPLANTTNNGTA
jgi:hypothetical protein